MEVKGEHLVLCSIENVSKDIDQFFQFPVFSDVWTFAPVNRVEILSRPMPVQVTVNKAHLSRKSSHVPFDQEYPSAELRFEISKIIRERAKSHRTSRLVSVDAADRDQSRT
jgi:hypothetical protein